MSGEATRHFIVGTAGHVDHGKSALVRTLTGTDPDRLPEERARGITIDLGFAHLTLPGLDLGIVDVPGHEDFIKNMVAGVGAVDLALLAVAADDGWMPQTEEHLLILEYLGVTRAVVALTKIDLVSDEERSIAKVRERLAGTPFAAAPIVPTSVPTSRGMTEIKSALADVLSAAPPPRDAGKPRLPIDRVFALKGIGTVVTGTLTGGTLSPGQAVTLQPSGRTGHVRSVQSHGREIAQALPGTRTALNLPDFTATGDGAAARGEVVVLPDLGGGSPTLDVLLTRSGRQRPAWFGPGTSRPLADGKMARLHLGSGHWAVRVSLLDGGDLAAGERSIARLHSERPVFALAGDRFILRDGAGRHTLAGGTVLDPDAGQQRIFRRGRQRRFLESAAGAAGDPGSWIAALLERNRALPGAELLLRSTFSATEVLAATRSLVTARKAVQAGKAVVDAAWWSQVLERATSLVDADHHTNPEKIGLSLARLKAETGKELAKAGLFDELLSALTARGAFVQVGASIRRVTHQPRLPEHLRTAGERLRGLLARRPFEPPSRQLLAPDGPSRQALRFLCDTGEVEEFGEEVVLLAESFRRMKNVISRALRSGGPATASDLRQVLGTTRRVLIPVLEKLDRDGITRRDGDRRSLRAPEEARADG